MLTTTPTTALTPSSYAMAGSTSALSVVPAMQAPLALQLYQPPPAVMMPQPMMPPVHSTEGSWGDVTVVRLRELIDHLKAHWKLGLAAGALAAAGMFYSLGMGKKVFEAESKLEARIMEINLLDVNGRGGGPTEQSSLQIMNNHRTNLTTRRFTDYLFDKMPVEERDAWLAGVDQLSLSKRIQITIGLSSPPPKLTPKDQFAKKLEKSARVEPVKDSHVVRIAVRDGDPNVAASISALYAKSYIDYMEDDASDEAEHAVAKIGVKVQEAKKRLHDKELELSEFSQRANLLKAGEAGDLNMQQADNFAKASAEVAVELMKAQEKVRQFKQTMAEGRDVAGVRGLGDDLQMIEIQKKLIEARSRRDALLEWCSNKHPKLVQTRAEVQRLEEEGKTRMAAIVGAAEDEERRLMSEKQNITKLLSEARNQAFGEGTDRSRQKQLADEVEEMRAIYTDLIKHQERARLASELRGASHMELIDTATPPESPVWPVKSLALLASMIAFGAVGLGLPIGVGLSRQHLLPLLRDKKGGDEGFAQVPNNAPQPTSHQPSAVNYQPVAHAMPMSVATAAPGELPAAAQRRSEVDDPTVLAVIPPMFAADGGMQLGELLHPSPISGQHMIMPLMCALENIRQSRGAGMGVLLVTSSIAGEGKSLVSSGLAAAMCTAGRRVLLMDCHPTAPAIPNWFPHAVGHSATSYDLEALRYGQSNLFLLPAHDLPSYEMSELLDGYRCWLGIAQTQGLDWVIMDGTALMSSFADVAQLALLATDVVLVHDAAMSDPGQVRAAINLLKPLGAERTLRGVVMNRHG